MSGADNPRLKSFASPPRTVHMTVEAAVWGEMHGSLSCRLKFGPVAKSASALPPVAPPEPPLALHPVG